MAADPSGLDLLLMASTSANDGGAGLPLSSPRFFGEGHEQEEDYSGFVGGVMGVDFSKTIVRASQTRLTPPHPTPGRPRPIGGAGGAIS